MHLFVLDCVSLAFSFCSVSFDGCALFSFLVTMNRPHGKGPAIDTSNLSSRVELDQNRPAKVARLHSPNQGIVFHEPTTIDPKHKKDRGSRSGFIPYQTAYGNLSYEDDDAQHQKHALDSGDNVNKKPQESQNYKPASQENNFSGKNSNSPRNKTTSIPFFYYKDEQVNESIQTCKNSLIGKFLT